MNTTSGVPLAGFMAQPGVPPATSMVSRNGISRP